MLWSKSSKLQAENRSLKSELANCQSILGALDRSMAVIEFDPTGHVISANDNFQKATGYSLEQIRGQHHKMFCSPEYARSEEYRKFWSALAAGEVLSGRFERRNSAGETIWLEASYNPIRNADGDVHKVIKFAADITARVTQQQSTQAKVDALSKSTAIIEFNPDGTIIDCNDNFLHTVGYQKSEIIGRHHRIFCEPSLANSEEYDNFWKKLNRGEFVAGQFKRLDASGRALWLEASYNPVYDMQGRLFRVVKFASDITAQTELAQKTEDSAGIAKKISAETYEVAQQGGQVIENAASEMNNIAESVQRSSEHIESLNARSSQINSIISTIQEIADQTNLLALNAAIEAARAGDQGRGFAVVADEVRQLAARTSQSTAEISSMIHSIQEDTSSASSSMKTTLKQALHGVELANETGEVIARIQTASSEVVSAIDSYSNLG
ncbi:MAG: PAS domain-containing methyl-accepting chemotaxis protein [Cellvibrionaceae bacterium]|nr:PAS domain-containing methyl-accepting chemotaxis protein [Cellvibrionaceae bacterium]